MSVILKASGGGSVTLQEPSTASDYTLSLPATTGTMALTNNAGLSFVRITGGTLSSASAITVDGCFTSTYKNYYIYVNTTHSSGGSDTDFYFQYRASGVTNGSSNYAYQTNYINAGLNAGTAAASIGDAGSFSIYDNLDNGGVFSGWFQILNPQVTGETQSQWFLYGADNGYRKQMLGFGSQNQSTSFDGFTITMSQGTITGTYDVYGIAR
jgi:hypothetical protein